MVQSSDNAKPFDRLLRELRASSTALRDGYVFTSETGGPIAASNLRRRSFDRLLRKAGVRPIRFHDMRHTAATLMLLAGVPIKVVSERLGHSKVAITLDVYQHVLPSMQREAVRLIDDILDPKPLRAAA